jgi:hypothetical protein
MKIGTVALKLGDNNGLARYEGTTDSSRILIRQNPWETWNACIVKKSGKGAMIVSDDFDTPEQAGQALLNEVIVFHKGLEEFIGHAANTKLARCYSLLKEMSSDALDEAITELDEIHKHYESLAKAKENAQTIPAPAKVVSAIVTKVIKSAEP